MEYNNITIVLVVIVIAIVALGIITFNPFAPKLDTTISITNSQELTEGGSF